MIFKNVIDSIVGCGKSFALFFLVSRRNSLTKDAGKNWKEYLANFNWIFLSAGSVPREVPVRTRRNRSAIPTKLFRCSPSSMTAFLPPMDARLPTSNLGSRRSGYTRLLRAYWISHSCRRKHDARPPRSPERKSQQLEIFFFIMIEERLQICNKSFQIISELAYFGKKRHFWWFLFYSYFL